MKLTLARVKLLPAILSALTDQYSQPQNLPLTMLSIRWVKQPEIRGRLVTDFTFVYLIVKLPYTIYKLLEDIFVIKMFEFSETAN